MLVAFVLGVNQALGFLAVAGIVFGVLMFGIDYAVGMPLLCTVGEGPYIVMLSVVILWLTGRASFRSTAAAA